MRKVAIVGVEGSGKTVMLAGLGDLYTYPDEDGYFLAPKNFSTAAYVAEKIERMRKGEWPTATAGDEMQGLDWTLRRRTSGSRSRPEDICEVSFLDFAGEVYRAAYGISGGGASSELRAEAERLKTYVSEADDLIVLINLRDVVTKGVHDKRVQEAMWITKAILDTALGDDAGRDAPRAAIVLSQADSYAATIEDCGGAAGVLQKYLPYVANDYNWLDIFAVNAVDKTELDGDGNVVPAHDFTPTRLRKIMDWIRDGLEIDTPHVEQQQRSSKTPSPADPPPRQPERRPVRQPNRSPRVSSGVPPSGIGQYFTFRGRKNRAQFWRFYGFLLLSGLCVGIFSGGNEYLMGLWGVAMIWPCLSNAIRRLHDLNRSGWWLLVSCIPVAQWIFAVVIGLIEGTDGDNDYGPEP